jgi:hypothetical protein
MEVESNRPPIKSSLLHTTTSKYGAANKRYYDLFKELRTPTAVPVKAPVPDDLERRVIDIKGMGYFLDAAHVGICAIPENTWIKNANKVSHDFAIVIGVEHGRIPGKIIWHIAG